jgi:NADH-quinone oxidoreductase subunit E
MMTISIYDDIIIHGVKWIICEKTSSKLVRIGNVMELKQLLKQYPQEQTYLLDVLSNYQKQKATQHLTEDELQTIAEYLKIPDSHVYAVIKFYSFFSMVPRGKYIVQFCRDVPCHIAASFDIKATLETILNVKTGQTTSDGLFTLEYTSCLGSCDRAPAIRINDKMYFNITAEKLHDLIISYRSQKHD